jgi:hypothetical protein
VVISVARLVAGLVTRLVTVVIGGKYNNKIKRGQLKPSPPLTPPPLMSSFPTANAAAADDTSHCPFQPGICIHLHGFGFAFTIVTNHLKLKQICVLLGMVSP